MFPEEYKSTLLSLIEAHGEDMKTLLGLFHLLRDYTTEEALVKNFMAITGKDCRGLLKELRRSGILKIGAHNEYLCLSGYEVFFDDITARYSPQPGDLSEYFEEAMEWGDEAALKMIELLLKSGKHGTAGFTQYELIRTELSEMFSPEIFQALEERLIKERLCIYGKKREKEFLELYQSDDAIRDVKARLKVWKEDKLNDVMKRLEREIEEVVADARRSIRPWRAKMAEQAGLSEREIEETTGYFSGFTMDDSSLFITCNMLIHHDTLYIAITDSLSRFEAREWKDFPVLFIAEEIPKWIGKMGIVFKEAYPELKHRQIAIAVPGKIAYANFEQNLLFELLNRLGISESEIRELPKG
ncbi:MAG: hypothetical protein ACXQTW_06360 [Candidatus Methanospirareceae archaeon]